MANYKRMVRNSMNTPRDDRLITPRLDAWLHKNSHLLLDGKTAKTLADLVTTPPRVRSGSFSSSSRGSCVRAQMFGYIGVPQVVEVDPVLHSIFIDGTWRHIRWQMMLLTAGIITRIEYPFYVPELRLRGSLDGANVPEQWGFELKGTSKGGIVTGIEGPIPYHILQIHTYFLGIPQLKKFSLVYEDKKFQSFREEVIERDPAVMVAVESELAYLNDCVDNRKLPPVLKECSVGKGDQFKQCRYRKVCLGCTSYSEAEALAPAPAVGVAIGPRRRKRAVPVTPKRKITPTVERVRSKYAEGPQEAPVRRRKRRKVHPA